MKTLLKLFVALLVVVAIAVVGAFFYVDVIARKAIEQGGEMALGVPTRLDVIHISLLGGEVSMGGLNVANPTGFEGETFLGLGKGEVAVSLGSLLGNTVVVPHVRLNHIRINLEQMGKKNNVDPILARARSLSGGKGKPASASEGKEGKKFIIEYFSLDDVQIDASLDFLGEVSKVNLVLPKIEMRNLGAKEQGLPMSELIQKVVQAVLSAAQKSSGQLSPALAKLLAGELGDLDSIKTEVLGQAKARVEKQAEELQKKIDEQVPTNIAPEIDKVVDEKGGDLLKDLLGKDKK
jgi:hypothetical protein